MAIATSHIIHRAELFFFSLIAWATFGLAIIFYLLPCACLAKMRFDDPEKQRLFLIRRMRKIILTPLRVLPQVKLHFVNKTNETFQRQAVIICNHRSFFDILACLSLTDKMTVLIKASYRKNFLIRTMKKLAGYHFIHPDPFILYKEVEQDIRKGYSLLVFPEGTRSDKDDVGTFSNGAFTLARYFNLDILPVVEKGFEKVLPKGRIIASAGEVEITVMPRISPNSDWIGSTIKKQTRMMENYYRECLMSKPSVCVIGGGMGGLFTGALLARVGYKVTVLEKNAIIGGGLQSFKRGNALFNTGLHNFGGWENGWLLDHMLRFLQIKKRLHVVPLNPQAQEIVWTAPEQSYRLPKGRENFEKYLNALFPSQKEGLKQYLDTVYSVADSFDYFMMRKPDRYDYDFKVFNTTVEDLLNQYITDDELKRILAYMTPLCGNTTSQIPISVYSMLVVLYLDGEYRFEDQSLQLAEALADTIIRKGGWVIPQCEVKEIKVKDGHVNQVNTTDGRVFTADKYVSSISPMTLFSLTSDNIVRKVSKMRALSFTSDASAFSIYIRCKEKSFPFINSIVFIPVEHESDKLPGYILLSTPPVREQDEWARTIEILVPCLYTPFEPWENTQTMKRGNDYLNFKNRLAQSVLKHIERYYPIEEAVERMYTASPLTIRDYYNNPRGAIFSQQGLYIPVRTRSDNFFLTGQSVLFHGLCGVSITAVLTAEAVSEQDILTLLQNSSE